MLYSAKINGEIQEETLNKKFKANSLNHSTPSPPAPGPKKITNATAWILIPESRFSFLLTGLKFDQYDTDWKNNYLEHCK